jgi:hypothetical protein
MVSTQKITREQIAAIVGKNPRAVKLLENLLADVSTTLPEQDAALAALQQASKGDSTTVLQLQQTVGELQAQLLALQRSTSTQLSNLRRDVEDARALLQGV